MNRMAIRSPIVSANEAGESQAATTDVENVGVPEGIAKGGQVGETAMPQTQDNDLWMEATLEETESEWWL